MKLRSLMCGLLISTVSSGFLAAQEPTHVVSTAVAAPVFLNPLHLRSWVRLDSTGVVHGRVLVIEASDRVTGRIDNRVILSRNGKMIYETRTGADGVFEIKGVAPGSYAIQSVGDYTYAAMALHILPAASENRLASTIEIYASTVGDKARQFIVGAMVPSDLEVGQDVYYRSFDKDPLGDQRQFSKGYQVALRDGNLMGRVSRPGWGIAEQDLSDSVIRIMQGGEVVATTKVEKDGSYLIADLTPGIYDFLVAGGDGFAAFKFEAVDAIATSSQTSSGTDVIRFVTTLQPSVSPSQDSSNLNVELVAQPEFTTMDEQEEEEVVYYDDYGYAGGGAGGGGGMGGGLGGGGAGGGGAGGLAGLAGIAGLAVGVSALANSDDPVPSTPAGP